MMMPLMYAFLSFVICLAVFSACTRCNRGCVSCNCSEGSVAGVQITRGDERIINGKADLHDASYETLIVNGVAFLDRVNVRNKLVVNGRAVIGKCSLPGAIVINGSMQISDSTIGTLELSTSGVQTISNSQLASILVKNVRSGQSVTLELKDTIVAGDVQFESGMNATLVLKKSVVKGRVVGATVQQ